MGSKQTKRKKATRQSFSFKKLFIEYGNFTAQEICLEEAAINHVVLRISLPVNEIITRKTRELLRNRRLNGVNRKKSRMKERRTERLATFNEQPVNTKFNDNEEPVKAKSDASALENEDQKDQNSSPKTRKRKLINNNLLFKSPKRRTASDEKSEHEKTAYCLKLPSYKFAPPSRLNFSFANLLEAAKHLRLPSKDWKIKFLIHKGAISFITITNDDEMERSVTFSLRTSLYTVIVDKVVVSLLACPRTIDTVHDVEILVDIISSISLNDHMIIT